MHRVVTPTAAADRRPEPIRIEDRGVGPSSVEVVSIVCVLPVRNGDGRIDGLQGEFHGKCEAEVMGHDACIVVPVVAHGIPSPVEVQPNKGLDSLAGGRSRGRRKLRRRVGVREGDVSEIRQIERVSGLRCLCCGVDE